MPCTIQVTLNLELTIWCNALKLTLWCNALELTVLCNALELFVMFCGMSTLIRKFILKLSN